MTAPAGADTVRPTVTSTAPPAGSSSVATNAMISASFSEDMNPATISGASFIVTNVTLGSTVTGSVSYSVVGKTALFTPAAALASNATFTARITSGAADLAGNDLAERWPGCLAQATMRGHSAPEPWPTPAHPR